MFAIKEVLDIHDGVVTIRLPDDFPSTRAEIIVLPIEEPSVSKQRSLQEILLNAPTLTDEELQPFEEVREWMNQWNVQEF